MILKALFLLVLFINFTENCKVLRYKGADEDDVYTKFGAKKCNGKPVYKALDRSSYIYKSMSGYWCDQFIPSDIIICGIECNEVRFKADSLAMNVTYTPEEFEFDSLKWVPRTAHTIMCDENLESLQSESTSTPIITTKSIEITTSDTTEETPVKTTEEITTPTIERTKTSKITSTTTLVEDTTVRSVESRLDETMEKIRNKTQHGNEENAMHKQKSEGRLTNLKFSVTDEDKIILNTILNFNGDQFGPSPALPERSAPKTNNYGSANIRTKPKSQVQGITYGSSLGSNSFFETTSVAPPIIISTFTTTTTTTTTTTPKTTTQFITTTNPTTARLITSILTSSSAPLIRQPAKSLIHDKLTRVPQLRTCPRIEFQIFGDDNKVELNLNFEIFFGVECRGYPVFKSTDNFYLYRNTFGDWCQDNLEQFQISVNCVSECQQMRLLPQNIKSPIESNQIEIIDQEKGVVETATQNFRFMCASFVNCMLSGCMNGGTCEYSYANNNPTYKCLCPPAYTGVLCDTLQDPCFFQPCQNGGKCITRQNSQVACVCTEDFYGNNCEFKNTSCKVNPCLNGGTCLKQLDETKFECKCQKNFAGEFCDKLDLNICANRNFGEFVAHPTIKTSFLVCLDGHYNVQVCPNGLVFNTFLNRCDYNDAVPDNIHVCSRNPCLNGGTCERLEDHFSCHCPAGFAGEYCGTNIDDCAGNDRCGAGGRCIDLINGWVCICENNYYGVDCNQNKIKIPCDKSKQALHSFGRTQHIFPFDPTIIVECNEKGNLLLNKCPSSLYWNPYIGGCTYEAVSSVRIECLSMQCKNGAKCELDINSKPICVCEKGYKGEFCEININECESNPCMNNATCVDSIRGHFCLCADKFVDSDCCCNDAPNPCVNVMKEFNGKRDKTVRYPHPYTMEKFIVCSLEGNAQILACPNDLIWSEEEQTCAEKSKSVYSNFHLICALNENLAQTRFVYPYSKLKFIQCSEDGDYQILECPKNMPYFCERKKQCVRSLIREC